MQPGTKPQPTRLKVLNGNPGKRPLNASEPHPAPAGNPPPPDWLDATAAERWVRTVEGLGKVGVLTDLDLDALEMYCKAYSRWREAEGQIDKATEMNNGEPQLVMVTKGGKQRVPQISIAAEYAKQMRSLLSEFGMTPSSRSRVSGMLDPDDDGNLLDRLRRGNN